MSCQHELHEMETACAADRLCPICLAEKLEAAYEKLSIDLGKEEAA